MNNYIIKIIILFHFLFFYKSIDCQHSCYINDTSGVVREKSSKLFHLDLFVEFDLQKGKVLGKANYKFIQLRPEIDTIHLDAINFEVSNIQINNKPAKYRVDSNYIVVYIKDKLKDTNALSILYSCNPDKGLYFFNWKNKDPNAIKHIWTQGQGIDNRHWIPGFDDVANLLTTDLYIKFENKYPVISNGELIKKSINTDNTITWHYKMSKPHALYLIMIAAGDYEIYKIKSKSGIEMEQYYYKGHSDKVKYTYRLSDTLMDWFENEIGINYPWGNKYRNVPAKDFLFGAMENTSSTIFSDLFFTNYYDRQPRDYMPINAHELAHQWFGDLITERNGTHHWLHESFATHYSKQFVKEIVGKVAFDEIKYRELQQTYNAGNLNSLQIAHSKSGSSRHYPKGSMVLSMLRDELGNQNFRKSIKYYLNKFKHSNVETNDLIASIYEATGRNVNWFFDQWILRGGEPQLDIHQKNIDSLYQFTILQTHLKDDNIKNFRLPLDIYIYYKNDSFSILKKTIFEDSTSFSINNFNKEIDFIVVDPENNILCKKNYIQNFDQNVKFIEKVNISIFKTDLLNSLDSININNKKEFFKKLILLDTSYLVSMELLKQIHKSNDTQFVENAINKFLDLKDYRIVSTAIETLKIKSLNLYPKIFELLDFNSSVVCQSAFEYLYSYFPEKRNILMKKVEDKSDFLYKINLSYLEKLLNDSTKNIIEKEKIIKKINNFTKETFHIHTRIDALNILIKNNFEDLSLYETLYFGMSYFNNRFSSYCKNKMKSLYDKNKETFELKLSELYNSNKYLITKEKFYDKISFLYK